MHDIFDLIQADDEHPKKIAVIGDALEDVWVRGSTRECQDGCPRFDYTSVLRAPGGAANAANQLQHWHSTAFLISPLYLQNVMSAPAWQDLESEFFLPAWAMPKKKRYVDQNGRIVFREDEDHGYGLSPEEIQENRRIVVKAVEEMNFDAVLLSDYDKGFLDEETISNIIYACLMRRTPIIADAKRAGSVYRGATLKANREFFEKTENLDYCLVQTRGAGLVVTHGAESPQIYQTGQVPAGCLSGTQPFAFPPSPPVLCANHVGAGDCFAAHLTLGLAHGLSLAVAARLAHAAGRVYVQHPHSRPPYPHEIAKDIHPARGKAVVLSRRFPALRQSLGTGRMVFTNGVFRLPHPGHSWLLEWAKSQGDCLVVGINDDESAQRLRPGELVLPLAERLEWLQQHQAVDWVIPFTELDPRAIIGHLRPDVLVKGHDYEGMAVPGDELVEDVRFAPESPYPSHATDLMAAIRAGS